MKNFILTLTIFFLSSTSFGFELGAKKLSIYHCDKAVDNCSGCSLLKKAKMDFLVNKDKGSVMRRIYVDNIDVPSSTVFKSCNVFDEKNWLCEEGNEMLKSEFKMTNGVYVEKLQIIPSPSSNDTSGSCAK